MISAQQHSGFTLIELMVVMTILAILSVIAIVSYTSVQQTSRDTRRREEVLQIGNAIESHKDPISGTYTYTTQQLQNDFRSNQQGAYAGVDPSGNAYCIVTYSSLPANLITIPTQLSSTATLCNFNYTTDTGANVTISTLSSAVNGALASGTKAWIVCAMMETTSIPSGGSATTPFCKGSSAGQ